MTRNWINSSLIFRYQQQIKHIVLLPGEEVKFGRDSSNDIKLALFPLHEVVYQLATADISRQHFVIRRKKDKYTIQDLGSTNGTSVNCIAVIKQEQCLQHQQTIDIGGVLELKVFLNNGAMWLKRITNTPQESYLLFADEISIGSDDSSVLMLPDNGLNNCQACIRYQDKRYAISKLNEQGKLLVDNVAIEKMQEYWLGNETHITLGDIDILFKIQQD